MPPASPELLWHKTRTGRTNPGFCLVYVMLLTEMTSYKCFVYDHLDSGGTIELTLCHPRDDCEPVSMVSQVSSHGAAFLVPPSSIGTMRIGQSEYMRFPVTIDTSARAEHGKHGRIITI